MSSRSIGRGVCPRCNQEGIIVVRRIGGPEYVYVRHGKKWCYIGPLSKIPLDVILIRDSTEQAITPSTEVAQPQSRRSWSRKLVSVLLQYRIPAILAIVMFVLCTLVYSALVHSGLSTKSVSSKPEFSFRDLVMQLLSEYGQENSCIVFAQDLVKSNALRTTIRECIDSGHRIVILGRGEDFNEDIAYLLADILFSKRRHGYTPATSLAIERFIRNVMSVRGCLYAAITLQLGRSKSGLGIYCIAPTGNVRPERELRHLLSVLLNKS